MKIFSSKIKKDEISPKISPRAKKEQKTQKKERLTCFDFLNFLQKR